MKRKLLIIGACALGIFLGLFLTGLQSDRDISYAFLKDQQPVSRRVHELGWGSGHAPFNSSFSGILTTDIYTFEGSAKEWHRIAEEEVRRRGGYRAEDPWKNGDARVFVLRPGAAVMVYGGRFAGDGVGRELSKGWVTVEVYQRRRSGWASKPYRVVRNFFRNLVEDSADPAG